jgi:hypothetical protein
VKNTPTFGWNDKVGTALETVGYTASGTTMDWLDSIGVYSLVAEVILPTNGSRWCHNHTKCWIEARRNAGAAVRWIRIAKRESGTGRLGQDHHYHHYQSWRHNDLYFWLALFGVVAIVLDLLSSSSLSYSGVAPNASIGTPQAHHCWQWRSKGKSRSRPTTTTTIRMTTMMASMWSCEAWWRIAEQRERLFCIPFTAFFC